MMNGPETAAHDFPEGLPIYDCNEKKLGTVSAFGVQSSYLVMRTGRFFHRDVSVPVSAIQRSDAQGVYLNRTREEIHDLTLGGWSSLGNVDLNTGVGAGDEAAVPTYPRATAPDSDSTAERAENPEKTR
jgi:hypothetical protein